MQQIVSAVMKISKHLIENEQKLTVAESCTGGLLCKVLTDAAGASKWFEMGFVTYCNDAKHLFLEVAEDLFEAHGAVSAQVAEAMAKGAVRAAHADYGIAITGIAGPDGGSIDKPIGTVYIAWATPRSGCIHQSFLFSGDRMSIREQAMVAAVEGLIKAF